MSFPIHSYSWTLTIMIIASLNSLAFSQEVDQYIVFMDSNAMPKAFSTQQHWHSATLDSVSLTTSSSNLIYSYTHVIDGFSATLSPSELESLQTSPGFLYSIKDLPVKHDTTHSTQFLGLTDSTGAWKSSNYGEGMIIGVVDTGVWPESQSYSDHGMPPVPTRWKGACETGTQFNTSLCNNKLIGARAFNKGLIARNISIAMNSARDTEGHGTHTSSTAAGSFVEGASYFGYAPGTLKGVAPKAHVAMYKALFDEGAFASDIIAAIDQAIGDGVDVMSMSLGLDGVALYEDPIALATFAAVEKNVFVATSAGNSGPFLQSLHNGIPWVLTVAAGTIDREFEAEVILGNGNSVFGSSLYPGNYSADIAPIVFMGDCLNATKIRGMTSGKIVICQEKNSTLRQQLENVKNSSAIGGIFIANISPSDLEFLIQSPFQAIFMTLKDGERLKKYVKSNALPKASLNFQVTNLKARPAPAVTSYSSRGPSPSCPTVLKPDIMGPGSLILASWPSNVEATEVKSKPFYTDFNLLSGTSMSCPHLAGVGALIKKAHPEWSPAAIRSAMMTTADVTDLSGQPIQDLGKDNSTATGLAIGAGQVNPNKAMDPGLVYDLNSTDYVNLLCALNFSAKQIQAITRSSTNNCDTPSMDLNYPSFIAIFDANYTNSSQPNQVMEFPRTLTNVGEGMTSYVASFTPLEGINMSVIPGKLEFKSKGEKLRFKLVIESDHTVAVKKKSYLSSGYLKWIEDRGNHVVQSPIVVTNFDFQS
ncbi:Subtilisin-like protease SBT3 [Linum perenne]